MSYGTEGEHDATSAPAAPTPTIGEPAVTDPGDARAERGLTVPESGAADFGAAGSADSGGHGGAVPNADPAQPSAGADDRGEDTVREPVSAEQAEPEQATGPAQGGLFSSGEAESEIGPTGRPWPNLPEPAPPAPGPKHATIIAMCNQKGGVGKTTTTINLGAALAETGRKVLLVDFDPQGSLSVGLGINPHTLEESVYNVLLSDTDAADVISESGVDGMDILPANIDLSAAEVQLVSEVAREQILASVLRPVRSEYDVILIDCAPSLGLLTINALTASDGVIMPLECEFFALRGIALLTDTIHKVQQRLNPDLQILGILGTMFDGRTLHSREVLERVVQAFDDSVFHTVIRRTVKFPETTVAGEPITSYASSSAGAQAYRNLAREVLQRCPAS